MPLNYATAFVTIAAVDFTTVVRFYEQLLEIEPNPYITQVYAEFSLKGLKLGIFYPKKSHQEEFSNSAGSGMSLCLEVADLDKAIASLTQLGYPPLTEIMLASHGREVYVYDPAGNRLILHQSINSLSVRAYL